MRNVHGCAALDAANMSIRKRYSEALEFLLKDYQLKSNVFNPEFGTWAMEFSAELPPVSRDTAGFLETIRVHGRLKMREILESELGTAIGGSLAFCFAAVPRPPEGHRDEVIETLRKHKPKRAPERGDVNRFSLKTAMRAGAFAVYAQPIVRAAGEMPTVGYELLTRGPKGSPMHSADDLFSAAEACDLVLDVERHCFDACLETASHLADGAWASLNSGPDLLCSGYPASRIAAWSDETARRRLIVELTHLKSEEDLDALAETVSALRATGARFALGCAGCGMLTIAAVKRLKPDMVKLAPIVTRYTAKVKSLSDSVSALLRLVNDHGGEVVAEGIEGRRQAKNFAKLGVHLLQGFLFGGPALLQGDGKPDRGAL